MLVVRSFGAGLFAVVCVLGCDPPEGVSCGPGTVLVGDQCVADRGDGGSMSPPPGSDAGVMDPPPPPRTDAGVEWSDTPPVTGPPPEPGCDMATGECAAWADALVTLLAAHPGRGCAEAIARPEGMQAVADRHARHQAEVDMLDSTSPDGDLFRQVRDEGVPFMYAGALFSVGRLGAEDVMGRWAEGGGTREVLDQCWTMAGVSFATGESGWSYATVLLAR
ncbi:MAG: hypothetical protein KC619_09490 [Myxococcales bacterium]|nr:hypothetical protein [Myxococcales bacterium]